MFEQSLWLLGCQMACACLTWRPRRMTSRPTGLLVVVTLQRTLSWSCVDRLGEKWKGCWSRWPDIGSPLCAWGQDCWRGQRFRYNNCKWLIPTVKRSKLRPIHPLSRKYFYTIFSIPTSWSQFLVCYFCCPRRTFFFSGAAPWRNG